MAFIVNHLKRFQRSPNDGAVGVVPSFSLEEDQPPSTNTDYKHEWMKCLWGYNSFNSLSLKEQHVQNVTGHDLTWMNKHVVLACFAGALA